MVENLNDYEDKVHPVFNIFFSKFYIRSKWIFQSKCRSCLLYTSDAADERSSVDLGGRSIIKKKKKKKENKI